MRNTILSLPWYLSPTDPSRAGRNCTSLCWGKVGRYKISLLLEGKKSQHTQSVPRNTVPVMSCRVKLLGKGKCLRSTLPWCKTHKIVISFAVKKLLCVSNPPSWQTSSKQVAAVQMYWYCHENWRQTKKGFWFTVFQSLRWTNTEWFFLFIFLQLMLK